MWSEPQKFHEIFSEYKRKKNFGYDRYWVFCFVNAKHSAPEQNILPNVIHVFGEQTLDNLWFHEYSKLWGNL